VEWIRQQFRRLVARIRRNFPRLEYCAAIELTKRGTPHLHVLTRGDYIPQTWLSTAWKDLTGSYIVHIRKIDQVAGAVLEVTKYLTKSAAQIAELLPGKQVLTMSHGWLPEGWRDKPDDRPTTTSAHFFPILFSDLVDVIGELGGFVTPEPLAPGRYLVQFERPPDILTAHFIRQMRGWHMGAAAFYLLSLAIPDQFSPADFANEVYFHEAFGLPV